MDIDGHRMVSAVDGLWSANLGFGPQEIRNAIVEHLDEAAERGGNLSYGQAAYAFSRDLATAHRFSRDPAREPSRCV